MICTVLLAAILCGCSWRDTSYVVVKPHNEDYGVAVDSNTLTVNGYLSLKNALLNAVQDCASEIVIRAESYSGNLGEDLNQAVYEVTKMSPLGAYAVNNMTYDYSRIVSYYEINVNVTYKRTEDEIRQIVYVTDLDAIREKLEEAMENYDSRLILRVGDYHSFDLAGEVSRIFTEHPEYALELPETSVELYPESGTQRILDIKFTYMHTPEELQEFQAGMNEKISDIASLYGRSNNQMTNARRLYQRLGRDAVVERQDETRTLSNCTYGAIMENHASSYGYAQAYILLLEQAGIRCRLMEGQKNGLLHYWCLVFLDDDPYYVDPSLASEENGNQWFLLGSRELEMFNYTFLGEEEFPRAELPLDLQPVPEPDLQLSP